ncbi:hypothetical protein HDU67_000987 [Dinochytrium kinnereticum]|nr:hypothetical protein HDU67_000987 [Dinochytrium kinnereticum]
MNAAALAAQQQQMQQRLHHPGYMHPYHRSMLNGMPLNQPPLGMAGKDTRKKRIHATKSQLVILESSFLACPKPSSKARKAIAERIQLNERCVQIWFQNRRARQKKIMALEMQNQEASGSSATGSDSPETSSNHPQPRATPSVTLDLTAPTPTSEPASLAPSVLNAETAGSGSAVSSLMNVRRFSMPDIGSKNASGVPQASDAIFCETFKASSVAIGTWRRISMTPGDLICTLDSVRRTLRWMVVESTYGFQMEIPLYSILDVSVGRHTAAIAILTIDVASQPSFSKEVRMGNGQSIWVPCDDFTEAAQASTCRRHQLFTAASDPVILSFLAAVPHTSAGAAAAQAGLVPAQTSPLPSSAATPMTNAELEFTNLLSSSVDLSTTLNSLSGTSATTTPELSVSLSHQPFTSMEQKPSTVSMSQVDMSGLPNLPPILTDFGSLSGMRNAPNLFSATTPLTATTTNSALPTSSITTPTLSSPPSATSSLSSAASTYPTVRRQSCPNLSLAASAAAKRHMTSGASSSSASPLHRHLHNSTAFNLQNSGLSPNPAEPMFQRARSSSLSGLELIFQQHAIRSPANSVGGSAAVSPHNSTSPVIPTPIMEVPEPLSPLFGSGVAMNEVSPAAEVQIHVEGSSSG